MDHEKHLSFGTVPTREKPVSKMKLDVGNDDIRKYQVKLDKIKSSLNKINQNAI